MFFFRQSKTNILKTKLLQGMTDVHTHLLPAVDDGVQSLDDSLRSLLYLQELGVRRIYCTPHIMADMKENTPVLLQEKFKEYQQHIPVGLEMRLAGEYMLDAKFPTLLPDGLLTMANKHVLIETSYLSPPPDLLDMIYQVTLEGYIPIIAHPERYVYMDERFYQKLKDKDYKLQLNLFSLSGFYGKRAEHYSNYLLEKGFYDFTGSDFHDLTRYQNALEHLSLKKKQIAELERIIRNNDILW
ncbi:protein-tyrosine phosphatase [Parabacteroides sp. PF5-5]|nr:protein-tyrosine phosphatase [Parabacteroides sp. PF5-13]MDH6327552.1 protein-tyrosine phosphatase [Parabacteroides sp. PH5-41]MDH6335308.1 protein-tyrosine phosphatase [Parabacteroides sp. PF5-5]MDH6346371.1 protein-tyrosine phosphatase [Parabacteroides sp. PH5-46]MDH6361378.1 protein-tyrosine phosphatase [Parabacteroides sp. PH5-16]MDH6377045.1 protein-tyrosine phosphatase [Parabacteroides sp. PH5-33]